MNHKFCKYYDELSVNVYLLMLTDDPEEYKKIQELTTTKLSNVKKLYFLHNLYDDRTTDQSSRVYKLAESIFRLQDADVLVSVESYSDLTKNEQCRVLLETARSYEIPILYLTK